MKDITIFPAGISKSCRYAALFLKQAGYRIVDHITPEITHLMLDIPSHIHDGCLPDGSDFQELLHKLPENVVIIGGNLTSCQLSDYPLIDLLADPLYLARNAAITADCAIRIASNQLDTIWTESPVLILGWGRIGKSLANHLQAIGSNVTVAARNKSDRAMLNAWGFGALDYPAIREHLGHFRVLFNTVPFQTVDADILDKEMRLIKIDLASAPGLTCDNIINARGLPGKYAPVSTGNLIAHCVIQAFKEADV